VSGRLEKSGLEEFLILNLAKPLGLINSEIFLRPEWGSGSGNHRLAIRTSLAERIKSFGISGDHLEPIMNLSKVPRSSRHALSISHCPDLGGFCLVPNSNFKLGFDVEIVSRIKTPIVERVLPHAEESPIRSKLHTRNQDQFSALAWAAKECSIKCFGNLIHNATFSFANVSLLQLEQQPNSIFFFTAKSGDHRVQGLVTLFQHRVFSLAVGQLSVAI
jgi:phosphopantetheinyl transferase (holo-ACP synthase)